jgi:hypothetical protein
MRSSRRAIRYLRARATSAANFRPYSGLQRSFLLSLKQNQLTGKSTIQTFTLLGSNPQTKKAALPGHPCGALKLHGKLPNRHAPQTRSHHSAYDFPSNHPVAVL